MSSVSRSISRWTRAWYASLAWLSSAAARTGAHGRAAPPLVIDVHLDLDPRLPQGGRGGVDAPPLRVAVPAAPDVDPDLAGVPEPVELDDVVHTVAFTGPGQHGALGV